MSTPREEWRAVYINGVLRAGVMERGTLYIDSEELTYRRCTAIRVHPITWQQLIQDGGTVRTSGVTISLTPPRGPRFVPPVEPKPAPPPPKSKSLLSKLWDVFKEHYK